MKLKEMVTSGSMPPTLIPIGDAPVGQKVHIITCSSCGFKNKLKKKRKFCLNCGKILRWPVSEDTINEGLTVFKESKKLRKLLKKIDQQIIKAEIQEKVYGAKIPRKPIDDIKKMISFLADKFEELEKEYKNAKDKSKRILIKKAHKELKNKYVDILQYINQDKVLNALTVTGILSIVVAGLSMGLSVIMGLEKLVGLSSIGLPMALSFVGIPYLASFGVMAGLGFLLKGAKKLKDERLIKLITSIKEKQKVLQTSKR
jgi:hypothetical protein